MLLSMRRAAASRPRWRSVMPPCFNRRKRGGGSSEAGSRVQIDPCCSAGSERPPKENIPDGKTGFSSGGKGKDSNGGNACGAPAGLEKEGGGIFCRAPARVSEEKLGGNGRFSSPSGIRQPLAAMTTRAALRAQRVSTARLRARKSLPLISLFATTAERKDAGVQPRCT